ncbi:MAG: prepilin-type N-terminal cleavage/methylation domain-containing protein [bacterium]
MRSHRGFTLVELLVVLLIIGTLMAMITPNLRGAREQARQAALKMNCHNVQVIIEAFHMEQGYYADGFYDDEYGAYFPGGVWNEQIGRLPSNPYTGREMDPDDFDSEDYDNDGDNALTVEGGPNDIYGYDRGQIIYLVYDPPGTLAPTQYGLVGIQSAGISLRSFDAEGDIAIFVLHN